MGRNLLSEWPTMRNFNGVSGHYFMAEIKKVMVVTFSVPGNSVRAIGTGPETGAQST